jgi:hypothetical protein
MAVLSADNSADSWAERMAVPMVVQTADAMVDLLALQTVAYLVH